MKMSSQDQSSKMSEKENHPFLNTEATPGSPVTIKSTAVVKYACVETPATYAQLQHNTNLNLPPANWLRQADKWHGFPFSCSPSDGFSSFRMANMFTDSIGEVDVVSDAENIKKLLKIPYSKRAVSMMVHRIGNTLLIDEFDIHRHLLRTAEAEWQWLKKFYVETILKSMGEKKFCRKNKSRDNLQHKSLVSKFLYYSLTDKSNETEDTNNNQGETNKTSPVPLAAKETLPLLPDLSEEAPSTPTFARNVLWTFEDIQMLIGTDMPIFGSGTHPCVSLRLRDMTKPISVLTGIDYWLDNLMCNVPEVVMCYHLEGIVQKYELIKTEDLPHMEDSKFSSKVIRDIAQNILSFLKANATKAGHTYWLFKAKNDDVVKLYDLSSLCVEMPEDQEQNPFTVPVGLLLYKVALNMMKHLWRDKGQRSTIRALLVNCLALLDQEKYHKVVSSAHYMLSDLYVPDNVNPDSPHLSDQEDDDDAESEHWEDWDEDAGGGGGGEGEETSSNSPAGATAVEVPSLFLQRGPTSEYREEKYRPPPIVGSVQERCQEALKHLVGGLDCLAGAMRREAEQKKEQKEREEEQREHAGSPPLARPFQPIPMPFASLRHSQPPSALAPLPPPAPSWEDHLRCLLLRKATQVYATLAERARTQGRLGRCLRLLQMGLRCCLVLGDGGKEGQESFLLGLAGETFLLLAQQWGRLEEHREGYAYLSPLDQGMAKHIQVEGQFLPRMPAQQEEALQASLHCFQTALEATAAVAERESLTRKLATSYNELGNTYMDQALALARLSDSNEEGVLGDQDKVTKTSDAVQQLCRKSFAHLEASAKLFRQVEDSINLALVTCNMGRLMRACAHYYHPANATNTFTDQERHYYNEAQKYYEKALKALGSREKNPSVWDKVSWEFSTTLFNLGKLLQDFSSATDKGREEVEREVSEVLQHSLKLCELPWEDTRRPLYEFRAASIHSRLGGLYLSAYLNDSASDHRRRRSLQQAKTHYHSASKLFQGLEGASTELLQLHLEMAGMGEVQAQRATNNGGKVRAFSSALEMLLQVLPAVTTMAEGCTSSDAEEEEEQESQEREEERIQQVRLLTLLHQRLQFVLMNLTKLHLGRPKPLADVYKEMYALALAMGKQEPAKDPSQLAFQLQPLLQQLRTLQKKLEVVNKQSLDDNKKAK